MVAHFLEQEPLLQNPIFDALYCDEDRFDVNLSGGFLLKEPPIEDFNQIYKKPFSLLSEHDLFWEDEEITSLLSKEKQQERLSYDYLNSDAYLKMARNEAINWMLKVIAHYGFAPMTALLAVNYYDRFIGNPCFQRDKPWMSQLAALACLSIAAKVEETQVPLLLDFQVEESKHVFEAKTIQRMELLVLSTLQWKMNPVTPISFFDHIARRFKLIDNLHLEFSRRCENIVLSLITDCKLVDYLPSVIAAATMKYAIQEIEPFDALEYQDQLMSALRTSKENIDDCHKLIADAMNKQLPHKRRHESIPSSPIGVIDAYFSSDSSNDSWSAEPPLFKRSRAQDQHMRLAPLSILSVSIANDPH
ncbi:hypothetical protein ACS0TY_006256 [Phlomoides rotata]